MPRGVAHQHGPARRGQHVRVRQNVRAAAGAEREVKVREQHVTREMQQHVLGLEVAVYEAQQVQVLQRQQHLGGVKARMRLAEALVRLLVQQLEQLPAGAVLRAFDWRASVQARSPRIAAPPRASMMKYSALLVWNEVNSVATKGWSTAERISSSVRTRCSLFRSTIACFSSTFIAYSTLVPFSRTRCTFPTSPRPMRRMMWKSSTPSARLLRCDAVRTAVHRGSMLRCGFGVHAPPRKLFQGSSGACATAAAGQRCHTARVRSAPRCAPEA